MHKSTLMLQNTSSGSHAAVDLDKTFNMLIRAMPSLPPKPTWEGLSLNWASILQAYYPQGLMLLTSRHWKVCLWLRRQFLFWSQAVEPLDGPARAQKLLCICENAASPTSMLHSQCAIGNTYTCSAAVIKCTAVDHIFIVLASSVHMCETCNKS